MRAVVEELLARDLIVLDGIDTNFFERDALTGGFGRDVQGKEDDELIRVRAIEKGPATVSPLKALSETQSSDFLITGSWPAVSLPSPSTETMSGAYIVRMTSKFLPCLHNSTNLLATVLTLMMDSNRCVMGTQSG